MNVSRQPVGHEQKKEHDRGIGGDENKSQDDQQDHRERHRPAHVDVLEAVEGHVAHHGNPCIKGQKRGHPGHSVRVHRNLVVARKPQKPRHQRRSCGARQPLKEALVDDVDVGVEARQAKRRAGAVDERRDPAEAPQVLQRPLVDDEGRRSAEADHVGERVVFRAERALGPRQSRHAPVEGIEDHRDEDGDRGVVEALIHRHHDRVKAREQRRRGEKIGQQVNAAPADLGVQQRPAETGFKHGARAWRSPCSLRGLCRTAPP